jgi:hypothetical protein
MGSVTARAGPPPQALACPAAYRPRNPRATSLDQLLETHFETLKRLWEAYRRSGAGRALTERQEGACPLTTRSFGGLREVSGRVEYLSAAQRNSPMVPRVSPRARRDRSRPRANASLAQRSLGAALGLHTCSV